MWISVSEANWWLGVAVLYKYLTALDYGESHFHQGFSLTL